MKIAIIGLGLMGASFAKTLHAKGLAQVLGTDNDPAVLKKALRLGIIDAELTHTNAAEADVLLVCLYPRDFQSATAHFLPHLKSGAIVTDFCGNKRIVLEAMAALAATRSDVTFIGGHPMAGREFFGIDHAVSTLFDKASMILVPLSHSDAALQKLKTLYLSCGFAEVVVCDADHHDSMIAYTSQLCHIVSNAFIKNKSATVHRGYSAGSYKDLTRVARMNSRMWAELMTDNRDKLVDELDELLQNLQQYRDALYSGNEQKLTELLEEGNKRKLQIDVRQQ